MAGHESESGPDGPVADRLVDKAPIRDVPSTPISTGGWSDFVFAFHDREEIGPRMLARIAKHTGLKPEDL